MFPRSCFALRAGLALVFVALLSACNFQSVKEEFDDAGKVVSREYKGVDSNYVAYTNTWLQGAIATAQSRTGSDSSGCVDDRCREHIASLDAVARAGGQGQGLPPLAPPPPKTSWFREITGGIKDLVVAATPAAVSLDAGRTARHASDNMLENERIRTGGTVAMFQAQANSSAQSSEQLAAVAIAQAQNGGTRINVGDGSVYAPEAGVAQIGNSAGRDQLGEGANSGTQTEISVPGILIAESQDVQVEQGEGDLNNRSPITTTTTTTTTTDDGDDCSGSDCRVNPPPADPAPPAPAVAVPAPAEVEPLPPGKQ